MRKTIKILLFLLAGAMIILAAVSAYITVTFDKHDYRDALITAVRNFTDYQIEITEPLTADISIQPSFSAPAIKLILPDGKSSLEIRKFHLKLTPAALIQRHLQIIVSGLIDSQASLKLILPEELASVDSLTLAAKISMNGSVLKFTNLKLQATNKQGLDIRANGHGLIEDFSAPQPFNVLDLGLKISSPDSRTLKGYLPDDLPELGQLRGGLRLIAVSDQDLAARKINFNCMRTEDKLETRIKGEISRIPVDPDKPNTGIDLKLELHSLTTVTMNEFLLQSLPEIGPVRVKARVRGSKRELSIEDVELHAGNSGALEIRSDGRLKFKASGSETNP
ncbi:MAG: hypothetical protein KAG92_10900, partial [Deltaproteobacteria bacterium]|nr:hypothetical protein [Deltaproteobacteria bacterium]